MLNFPYGLLDLPWWGVVLATLALTHITIVAVTVYLHRHQAHRALALHPAVAHFFRFWLWLTTGMVTREWVAVHRKHHARVETPDDPHSPQQEGLGRVLWRGAGLYRRAAQDQDTLERFGFLTPDDWLERHLYSRHTAAGILLMLVLDLLGFGVAGLLVWGVQMAWIPFWAAGVINGVGHYWGYRNFAVPDASTNIVPWGILIGGEELHNNHHAYASSARFAMRPWEFDLGWAYICGLQALGLARVRKLPPRLVQEAGKGRCDLETLRAVVGNRFQIMTVYTRQVVQRVYREELARLDHARRRALRRARRPLLRPLYRMPPHYRARLGTVLAQHSDLAQVQRMKEALQALWARSAASQDALVRALEDWCRQAESSGIEALREFARQLQGYRLVPAV